MKQNKIYLILLFAMAASCSTPKPRFAPEYSGGPVPSDKIAISTLKKYSNFGSLLNQRAIDTVEYNMLNGYLVRKNGIVFIPKEILATPNRMPIGDSTDFTIFVFDTARKVIIPRYDLYCHDYFENRFVGMDMLSFYTHDFVITKANFHSWTANSDTMPQYTDVLFAHRIDSPESISRLTFAGEQVVQIRQFDSTLVVISQRVCYPKNFWYGIFSWTKAVGLRVPRYKKAIQEEYYYNRFDRNLKPTKRNKIEFVK